MLYYITCNRLDTMETVKIDFSNARRSRKVPNIFSTTFSILFSLKFLGLVGRKRGNGRVQCACCKDIEYIV